MAESNIRPTQEEFLRHKNGERHKLDNPLRDVILGGQDGLVNALGIILGVSAATSNIHILIATVLAASIAESFSMGAVSYTSNLAQKDFYHSERKKELEEIRLTPEMEREEVRRIYEAKGLKGQALEEVVSAITADKKIWLDTMMSEELHIQPIHAKTMLKSAFTVTLATVIGHFIPLTPFFFTAHLPGLIMAIAISALTLFATGVYQALTLVGSWWKSGFRMLVIGLGSAAAGYLIARLFNLASA
ncbi:VIT1/CCC1 transporter family protein [Patescibacteria group bacterium]|nr:VIT1/CCC1 transporter family protein [Patescibacteria group bacterium]MCL5010094.1 VIT1/CCC1 transporter family protein [Patescibacteria group bacterium]